MVTGVREEEGGGDRLRVTGFGEWGKGWGKGKVWRGDRGDRWGEMRRCIAAAGALGVERS